MTTNLKSLRQTIENEKDKRCLFCNKMFSQRGIPNSSGFCSGCSIKLIQRNRIGLHRYNKKQIYLAIKRAKLQLLDEVEKIINEEIDKFDFDKFFDLKTTQNIMNFDYSEDELMTHLLINLKTSILGISDNEEGANK